MSHPVVRTATDFDCRLFSCLFVLAEGIKRYLLQFIEVDNAIFKNDILLVPINTRTAAIVVLWLAFIVLFELVAQLQAHAL